MKPVEPLSIEGMLDLLKDGVDNLDKLGAAFFKFDAKTGALQPLSEDELADFDLEANQVGFTFIFVILVVNL